MHDKIVGGDVIESTDCESIRYPDHGRFPPSSMCDLSDQGEPFAVVTLVQAEGSVPHNVGGKMIVTANGLDHGTVGGGRIESKAIEHAVKMLDADGQATDLVRWNLTTDVGMTCGGRVQLFFEVCNERCVADRDLSALVTLPRRYPDY